MVHLVGCGLGGECQALKRGGRGQQREGAGGRQTKVSLTLFFNVLGMKLPMMLPPMLAPNAAPCQPRPEEAVTTTLRERQRTRNGRGSWMVQRTWPTELLLTALLISLIELRAVPVTVFAAPPMLIVTSLHLARIQFIRCIGRRCLGHT